jgi:hypothetical protein
MRFHSAWALAAISLLAACGGSGDSGGGDLGGNGLGGNAEPPDLATAPDLAPAGPRTRKLDLLFMIDDSSSMSAAADELRLHAADFLSMFDDLAAAGVFVDLHVGVVTSDYGAGATTVGGCQASPGGKKGLLQAHGAAADAGCLGPAGDARFLELAYDQHGGAPVSNLPAGQDLAHTFRCMAAVGTNGCGFEHPLESVYAALHNRVENSGFLRDDALLSVVFLTNEDDGSAAPDSTIFDSDRPELGAYDTFRQVRYGIVCGDPAVAPPYGASHGPLTDCVPAPNPAGRPDRAYDVSRYIDFFTRPKSEGGVKADPSWVSLVAIDGPDTSIETLLVKRGTGLGLAPSTSYEPCGPVISLECFPREQHTCQNRAMPQFFADGAVRLNTVVRAVASHQIASICGENLDAAPDYAPVLGRVAQTIRQQLR